MIPSLDVAGVSVPSLIYGTAWKEADTERLVEAALACGFRAIDTANQRKHYFEAGVGAAIQKALASGSLRREDLFLQTKFTQRSGQDARLPYDPEASFGAQVEQSFASSLEHLGVTYMDSYVLHGPCMSQGLVEQDWAIWSKMEDLFRAGKTRLLGISNVSLEQLEELCAGVSVKPAMVQNRCYASQGWDEDVREFCEAQGIVYQGFSLLTANPDVLRHRSVRAMAKRYAVTPAQIVFRFALQMGMIALTGTCSPEHMKLDLAVDGFSLTAEEVAKLLSLR